MRQTAIGFKSGRFSLEGILTIPQEGRPPFPALLVCHPHPALGGNMDSPLITAICRAADPQGIATFRFNFRGVGGSQGQFSDGQGEQQDLRAALDLLRRWPGLDRRRLALMGYSFGASVVLTGLRRYKAARSLALVAPPLSSVHASAIGRDKRPKLFIVGSRDRIVPSSELQRTLDAVRPPLQFTEIADADHGLGGHERAVAERIVAFALESLVA